MKKPHKPFRERFRGLLQASPLYGLRLWRASKSIHPVILTDLWTGDSTAGQSLVEGSFKIGDYFVPLKQASRFLSHSRECPKGFSLFLHSFEWLRDLRAVGTNASRKRARELIKYWIHSHDSWTKKTWLEPSWHPEIMGQRLRYWLSLYDFFGASADDDFRRLFFTSLNRQFRHLQNTYKTHTAREWEYLQALVGLLFATCSLKKPLSLLEHYLKELEKALSQQLFEDGGHISRSPTIQFLLLRDLIDIRALLRSCAVTEPEFLQQAIQHIAPIVRFFRHTSGKLAHFRGILGDVEVARLSCHVLSSAAVDRVLSLSDTRSKGPQRCTDTGYERLISKGGLVILNAKPSRANPDLADKAFGALDFEWSILQQGLVCTNDIIFHDALGNTLSVDHSHNKEWPLQVSRQHKEGCHHLWVQLNYQQQYYGIHHEREFYLAVDPHDFRGFEKITFNQEGLVGIRFVFDKTAKVMSQSTRSIKIKLSSSSTGLASKTCRLVSSGAEQILTYSLSGGGLAVVLMASLHANTPKIIKWGFRLEPLAGVMHPPL